MVAPILLRLRLLLILYQQFRLPIHIQVQADMFVILMEQQRLMVMEALRVARFPEPVLEAMLGYFILVPQQVTAVGC